MHNISIIGTVLLCTVISKLFWYALVAQYLGQLYIGHSGITSGAFSDDEYVTIMNTVSDICEEGVINDVKPEFC